jgi:hypothetical protein
MARLVVRCPSCEGELIATRLTCKSCATSLEGKFDIPALLQLPQDDLAFVTTFVRSSGSLKAVAAELGVSYPTVRNRLDDILKRLDAVTQSLDAKRHEILDALENGKMTAEEAAEQLRKVGL